MGYTQTNRSPLLNLTCHMFITHGNKNTQQGKMKENSNTLQENEAPHERNKQ